MKNLLFIFLLLPGLLQAQQWQRQYLYKPLYNSVSISLEPIAGGKMVDTHFGLRYDRILYPQIGVYISGTHGKYDYIKESTKIASGITWIKKTTFISVGLTHHINRGVSYDFQRYLPFNDRALKTWSCEIGAGKLFRKFVVSFSYELILSNSSINIGYRF
jgi:hypothetical protein